MRSAFILLFCSLALLPATASAAAPLPEVVELNRHIRPILADNCFACHGPDQNARKADLRLDTEEGLATVLQAGKPDDSELIQRITSTDVEQRMPPAKFGKKLTAQQIELIRRWVAQGGKYQKHWSLLSAHRPDLPAVGKLGAGRNAVDRFILARLEQEGLKLSPEADRRTLIRRLAFDLTGLPPTPEQVDAFLADRSTDAYVKLVDRFLTSPHHGERLALYWLDLVRYADTGGYHSDNHREIAPYRDYVIQAFNNNKPFDQFTLEQLAGDLLPGATQEQKIASGYNRLLMTTEEGGAQAKEYQAKYAADRVRNVSGVWLGLTLGCAECHDHKFDPVKTREFYRFAAFFADVKEKPVGRQDQDLMPTPEQERRLKQLEDRMAPLQKVLNGPEVDRAQAEWEKGLEDKDKKGLPKEVSAVLAIAADKRNAKQKQALAAHYRGIAPQLEAPRKQLAELEKQRDQILKSVPSTLITTAVAPREMRVLRRGNWLDNSGEVVTPGVPAALAPALDTGERRATRLDLARWMLAADNPLTARVFVNRLWKLFFGQGLVRTLDDFGSQGQWPTHPELLDWLAVEFRGSGWNVRHLIKLMVLSATYRQASTADRALVQRDPYNTLLARQARFRLDAEMVRDNALAVSGLLVPQVGGASVKPYQPAGYWAMLNFPKREWQNDQGASLYRRGLYTYWCRTFPHPSLVAFDAPSREECTVDRPRSNTPLQALVLLNDPIYVESARAFAERIVHAGGGSVEAGLQYAFRHALGRQARAEEIKLLQELYQKHRQEYQADASAANAVLAVGARPAP
jgi:mono/diheme cytochrome c family protein